MKLLTWLLTFIATLSSPIVGRLNYCSMANGCPGDKCRQVSSCGRGGGGDGFGCVPGPTSCEYKDPVLKGKYREVTFKQAKQCIKDYALKNEPLYPMMKYLEVDADWDKPDKESDYCGQPVFGKIEYKKEDKFCWPVSMRHIGVDYHKFPFGVSVVVGAQTCEVYVDPRSVDILKIDDTNLSLADINFTAEQAVACAEKYVADHKSEYQEYKNHKPGLFRVPERGVAGSHAAVKDISKEWNFYTVAGGGIYLVVGARTCDVYGVNEKYYTHL